MGAPFRGQQNKAMAKKQPDNLENFEAQLFKAADKLRKNIDAAEYKHVVLGLIFLKHISDSFEALYAELVGKWRHVCAE